MLKSTPTWPPTGDLTATRFSWRRLFVAALLRRASQLLTEAAQHLVTTQPRRLTEPMLEFHSDAGAPEGALYVDGELIGHLPVRRL